MNYPSLGTSDLRVSEISFGCMSLQRDDQQNQRLLHQALDRGITLFDTADLYDKGRNEATVGRAFRGMRQRVVLASKVGNQWRPDGSGWDWNPRKDYILTAVEQSLKRLQTDYLDLYQLHGGTLDDPIDETIEAFELLKEQGKIRAYGISSIRPNVIREWVQRAHLTSVMMQYSLLDRRPEETCLALLHQHGIGVLARGSVAKGLLLNKPAESYLGHAPADVTRAAQGVARLTTPQRPAAAVATRFVLHHPAVTTAVVGIRTEVQLNEALQAGDTPPLTAADVAQLAASAPARTYTDHR
ncbi:Predicted oxidoreductase [Catalinimonas alkaloidigena]|uniref:Predicted oxidoreductase n=1 Tax=Catalinimonas alkaloidigena TaxID=1075417 RepID=A0A1G9T038_9BACT|nr:aldo/keto reductase [Catalinimonas alkaloidigena]SDM41051.1 Predicted oxidoreductase [Catalinimonas alkaloidigena]